MKNTLLLAGAHRGGESFSRAGVPALRNRIAEVLVADPVADRANTLATFWRNTGLPAQARPQPAETLVKRLWPEGLAFIAIDRPAAIAKAVALGAMIPVRWQILAQAAADDTEAAPVLGFAGTVLPSDRDLRTQSVALLRRLGMVVPDRGSRAIWGLSAFNQDALAALRRRVSEQSVGEIVAMKERRLPAGRLELFCGADVVPLRVERMRSAPPHYELMDATTCAFRAAMDLDSDDSVAIAVLPDRAPRQVPSMHLFVVESHRRTLTVRAHQMFGRAAALTD
jgi:hypothetical protein